MLNQSYTKSAIHLLKAYRELLFFVIIAVAATPLVPIGLRLFQTPDSDSLVRDLLPIIIGVLGAAIGLAAVVATFRSFIKSDTLAPDRSLRDFDLRLRMLEAERNTRIHAAPSEPLKDEDREALRSQLTEKIRVDLTTDVVKTELAAILDAQKAITESDHFSTWSEQASRRITQQIAALGGRANLNLFIGLALAITGVGFLIYYVQTGLSQHADLPQFVMQFLPRLSLVTIIELFSYFFLRLYKQAIDEIKYFQNEITNIDLKMLAASITQKLCPNDPSVIIAALSSTERNFLVPKDQRIVAEAAEVNIQTATQRVLEIIRDIAPGGKGAPASPQQHP